MSSVTTEGEARPSARTRIANWLNKTFFLAVAEDDPNLIKKARAFGTDERGRCDAIVESWIRQAQKEEQHTREQRHSQQQQQIERQLEQQAIAQQATTQQQLDMWWDNRFLSAMGFNDKTAIHPGVAILIESLAEVSVVHQKTLPW